MGRHTLNVGSLPRNFGPVRGTVFALPTFSEMGNIQDELFGSHNSLKSTLLTWAGKSSPITFGLWQVASKIVGSSCRPKEQVHARVLEAYTTLYGRVWAMFDSIRSSQFDPDLSQRDGLAQQVQPDEPEDMGVNVGDESDAAVVRSSVGQSWLRDKDQELHAPFRDLAPQ